MRHFAKKWRRNLLILNFFKKLRYLRRFCRNDDLFDALQAHNLGQREQEVVMFTFLSQYCHHASPLLLGNTYLTALSIPPGNSVIAKLQNERFAVIKLKIEWTAFKPQDFFSLDILKSIFRINSEK